MLAGRQAVLVLAAIKVGGATAMSIWHSTFYGGIAESDYGYLNATQPPVSGPFLRPSFAVFPLPGARRADE